MKDFLKSYFVNLLKFLYKICLPIFLSVVLPLFIVTKLPFSLEVQIICFVVYLILLVIGLVTMIDSDD